MVIQTTTMKKVAAIVGGLGLISSLVGNAVLMSDNADLKQDLNESVQEYEKLNETKEALEKNISTLKENLSTQKDETGELTKELNQTEKELQNVSEQLENYSLKLDEKDEQLLEYEKQVEELTEVQEKAENTIVEDELYLNEGFNFSYDNYDLEQLEKSELSYNDTDYNYKEEVKLSDVKPVTNLDNEDVHLSMQDGGVTYSLDFEKEVELGDDYLNLNVLGEDIQVSKWSENKLTYNKAKEYMLGHADSINVSNKEVRVELVYDDAVFISVDNKGEEILEGEDKKINGLKINVENVLNTDGVENDKVILTMGETVKETVEDGDEFTEDSVWDWNINSKSIGVTLNKDLDDKDENDKIDIISKGEALSLPNEFATVEYSGLKSVDTEQLEFEYDDGELEVRGDFTGEYRSYDQMVINETGMFPDGENESVNSMQIGQTDFSLDATNVSNNVTVGDVEIPANMSIETNEDDDVRFNSGIVIEDPEDNFEDNEAVLIVPEERVESELKVY